MCMLEACGGWLPQPGLHLTALPATCTHCLCLQTIADMIVFNKSRREARSRLVARSWERPYLKFKVGYCGRAAAASAQVLSTAECV